MRIGSIPVARDIMINADVCYVQECGLLMLWLCFAFNYLYIAAKGAREITGTLHENVYCC